MIECISHSNYGYTLWIQCLGSFWVRSFEMSSWDLIYLGDVRPLEFPHISNNPTQQKFELSLFSKVLIVFNVFCCPDVELPCSS